MASTKQSSGYTPTSMTQDSTALPRWLVNEFRKISTAVTSITQMLSGKQPLTTYTVASLPTDISAGSICNVSDGTSGLSWGATVTGGHSTSYLVRYNGTNWTVVGK